MCFSTADLIGDSFSPGCDAGREPNRTFSPALGQFRSPDGSGARRQHGGPPGVVAGDIKLDACPPTNGDMSRLRRLRLGARLGIAFALLLIALATTVAVGVSRLSALDTSSSNSPVGRDLVA